MVDPLTYACPACAQQPTEPCVDLTDLADPVVLTYLHAERIAAANSLGTVTITDEMINATGLV
jgi:hypothetical protein